MPFLFYQGGWSDFYFFLAFCQHTVSVLTAMNANLQPQDLTTFSHWSKHPLTSVGSREQTERSDLSSSLGKPQGLWISVDGEHDWKEWCEAQEFELDSLAYRTLLEIDLARVLWVDGESELLTFDQQYGTPCGFSLFKSPRLNVQRRIDWSRVAAGYAGIIIAPYVWSQRLKLDWYYPWDCASGCIWDASAIRILAT